MVATNIPPKKSETANKKAPLNPYVEASFVFVDSLNHAIEGLTVKFESDEKPITPSTLIPLSVNPDSAPASAFVPLPYTGTTDKNGHALTLTMAKRGQKISIFVKKRSGKFDLKGIVTPTRDINAYTIKSPELHLESTTKLTPKQELEEELNIPTIKVGEVMTVERLFGDLAPYIGSVQIVTEVGKITKDFPTKKTTIHTDEATGKKEKTVEIEHHFKVVKTDKPLTIALNLLGSKLNYPKSTVIAETQYAAIAKELDCEIAAIKAIAKNETKKNAYLPNGLPEILFERHIFYKHTMSGKESNPYTKFPEICNKKGGNYWPKGVNIETYQYEKLVKAAGLNKDAAIRACSWGAFQVLADPYEALGYESPSQIANECMVSMDNQIKLFVNFMKMKDREAAIIKHIKNKDWEKVASAYNGTNWKVKNPKYASDLEKHYNEENK
jgi:hypothetical protein